MSGINLAEGRRGRVRLRRGWNRGNRKGRGTREIRKGSRKRTKELERKKGKERTKILGREEYRESEKMRRKIKYPFFCG